MNGIEQAIEKMVQDATADLRERVEALEALAKAVRGAAWSLGGAEVEAVAEVRREPIRKGSNGHGNGPHHWSAALRQAAARRMKKKNSDPAFRRAIAKGNARRWREYRAQQNGSVP